MPATGGYFVHPFANAARAASLTCSGVSKSDSPVDNEITSRPAAVNSRTRCVIAIVPDGLTRARVSERKATASSSR